MKSVTELENEMTKKREASEAKEKVQEGKKTKQTLEPLKEYTTKPLHADCPYCHEQKKFRGISGHIREKHGIPGFTIQDLTDLRKFEKSLEDLTHEKLGDEWQTKIKNVSEEILKDQFPNLKKPGPEKQKPEEIPEKEIIEEEDLGKEDLKEEDLEAKPEEDLEEIPEGDEKNPVERRKFNWMAPFSLLDRRSSRK